MARRSLRPHLNQIRSWVQQGRTDAWIAHQLEVTVQDIDQFKRQNELAADADAGDFDDEIDLRAQDDELIAAELEKAEEERKKREEEEAALAAARKEAGEDDDEASEDEDEKPKRRGRRGGRGRRKKAEPLEATFDHGEEGYGLWLDPAVADNAVYAEHWAGHRPVVVTVEADRIVITRAGEEPAGDDD